MELFEKYFPLLNALETQKVTSQRQLSEQSGISLGHVNFLLKKLSEKGLVKIKNFKKNPNKSGYLYLLTAKGLEAKSQLAVRFVRSRLREYNHLRGSLTNKLISLEKEFPVNVIFVGPPMVKDFVGSVIKERHLNLVLIGHYNNWNDLKVIDSESFDVALLFDVNSEGLKKISDSLNIPQKKFAILW
jgi:EPS-associated MarR family transcriptional regulator